MLDISHGGSEIEIKTVPYLGIPLYEIFYVALIVINTEQLYLKCMLYN